MKFAYLILAHNKPNQLKKLVSMLINENNKVYIHIDSKTDITPFLDIKSEYSDNVLFTDNRISIRWAGFSMIKATLELFKTYNDDNFVADYVHLLSGTCLPLEEDEVIKSYFTNNNGMNFIMCKRLLPSEEKRYARVLYKWNVDESGWKKLGINEINYYNDNYYWGSQWFSITQECFNYLYNEINTDTNINNFFQYVDVSDESYFQTILMNSPFKEKIINDNLRHIIWMPHSPDHPITLNHSLLNKLKNTGKFWGRKFDLRID